MKKLAKSKKINLLIVDDEAIIRFGLLKILDEYPHINIIGYAASGEEAEQLAAQKNPDVILMDITMPGQGGITTTKNIVANNHNIAVLALSVHCDDQYPSHILNAGALGYITKGVRADEMIEAIDTVAKGEHYICHAVADKVKGIQPLGRDRLFDFLEPQEREMCSDIVSGKNLDTIAKRQGITPKEATQLKQKIYEKLHIKNDTSLVHLAIRNGLLDQ